MSKSNFPAVDLSEPFAPPYDSTADAHRQHLLGNRSTSIPKFVYNLYIVSREKDEEFARPVLMRTYSSCDLARHDALCWLMDEHWHKGATELDYEFNQEWEDETDGRCFKFWTKPEDSKDWGIEFEVYVTEEPLY
jgi:hypothetical protein